MTAKEKLKSRHQGAIVTLKFISQPKVDRWGLNKCAEAIAPNLGVSFQTVVNYVSGRAKDGFMTEAIISEFKSLKIKL